MRLIVLFLIVCIAAKGQQADYGPVSYKRADSIAAMHPKEDIDNLPVLAHKLTKNLSSDVEKFRAIYKWVCLNIEIDYVSYSKTKKKREKLKEEYDEYVSWNRSRLPIVFRKLANEHKTACTGYAYLIKELASLAGLECIIVNGYAKTVSSGPLSEGVPNHSWNAIKLDDKWHLCDATWSAGKITFEMNVPRFKKKYLNGFFLPDPALFSKNHHPAEPIWSLLQNPPTFSEFLENPIVYEEAFQQNIRPTYPKKMHQEMTLEKMLQFKLNSKKSLENIKILAIRSGNQIEINPIILSKKEEYTLRFHLDKPGFYDLHILVNDTAIATYTANISKSRKRIQ